MFLGYTTKVKDCVHCLVERRLWNRYCFSQSCPVGNRKLTWFEKAVKEGGLWAAGLASEKRKHNFNAILKKNYDISTFTAEAVVTELLTFVGSNGNKSSNETSRGTTKISGGSATRISISELWGGSMART